MAGILRGDIVWAELNPTRGHKQAGRRPVLILSHEVFNTNSGTVIALAITSQSQRAGFPLTFELPAGLQNKPPWIKISQIRTLSTERLGRKLGHLDEANVDRIFEGLMEIVGP
jgi:mRNA interferase MazF